MIIAVAGIPLYVLLNLGVELLRKGHLLPLGPLFELLRRLCIVGYAPGGKVLIEGVGAGEHFGYVCEGGDVPR